jgi:hypothetical protein
MQVDQYPAINLFWRYRSVRKKKADESYAENGYAEAHETGASPNGDDAEGPAGPPVVCDQYGRDAPSRIPYLRLLTLRLSAG